MVKLIPIRCNCGFVVSKTRLLKQFEKMKKQGLSNNKICNALGLPNDDAHSCCRVVLLTTTQSVNKFPDIDE